MIYNFLNHPACTLHTERDQQTHTQTKKHNPYNKLVGDYKY